MRYLLLAASHALALAAGFALGIYALPILTAPPAPPVDLVQALGDQARFSGRFERGLPGSDLLHWGEGEVFVANDRVALLGRLAPGPDYQLYLAPEWVDDGAAFERLKARSIRVGPVQTFENFVVAVPPGLDVGQWTTVVVWCESFAQFITAARYR